MRLLLIEDNPGDARLVQTALADHAPGELAVTWVERLADALARIGAEPFDAILCDLGLPDSAGIATVQAIAARVPALPLVVLTGSHDQDLGRKAMEHGSQDYLVKGESGGALIARTLRYAIERKRLQNGLQAANATLEHRVAERTAELDTANSLLRASAARQRAIIQTATDAIVTTGAAGTIVAWNPAAERMFGYTEAEVIGQPLTLLIPQRYQDGHLSGINRVQAGGERRMVGRTVELHGLAKSGSEFPFEFSLSEWETSEGKFFTGIIRYITERKKQEQKIARLSRIRAVLSGINSVIVRVRDRQVLFNDACRIAVEHGGFGIAWIGVLNQETLEITPAACAGADAESFLARSQNTAPPDTPMGQGVVGRAIREKRAASSSDITLEPGAGGERRKEAARRGYRSSISLPLLVDGAAVGNFSLFAKEANFFNADEVKLLTELAGDISFALEHIGKEEKLNYLAYYDALTGLPNRTLFDNRMTQCLRAANHEKSKVALVLIDLERFRVINDTFGRHTADGLLKLVAERLQSAIFDRDSLARIQGDVFAALFTDIEDEANIARILEEKIIGRLSQPFTIAGQELRVSAKAGVALFPGDATEPDALFSSAEAALKQAQGSSERYLFYAPQMNAQVAERLKLENKLQRALERGQFVLFYQPKVDLRTGRVAGLEALIRWNDPDTGLVPPLLFIPLLEETGMIVEVGAWAMKRAVSQYAAWLGTGLQPPRIAVNVSQVQLKRKDFVATVQRAIAIAGKPDHGLDLEITESMIMEDIESSIEKLKIVRDLGVGIAIDDFGTGYSSLRYLTRLPITALKIDRAFIQHMTTNPDDAAIVTTVIALGHNLHLKVIAEGVETDEQSKFLRLLNCDEIQGYLVGKPMPAEQMPALLESTSLALPAATTY